VRRAVVVFALLGLAIPAAVAGARTRASLAASLAYGFDDNPLLLADSAAAGSFAELTLGGSVDLALTPHVHGFLSGSGRVRNHESSLADADVASGDLRLGFRLTPNPWAFRGVVVSVGGLYGVRRATFIDRATGDVYEIERDPSTSPATTVDIPDRFDVNTLGAFLDVGFKLSERVRLRVNALLERAEYVENYAADTALQALDYRALTVEPGLFVKLHPRVAAGLSLVLTELGYDDQPALDGSGQAVADTTRQYDYRDLRLTLRVAPAARWSLEAGFRGGRRQDAFAGFYDFDSRVGYLTVSHQLLPRTRLQLHASSRELDYDHAEVAGSVEGELRASEVRRIVGRVDWRFRGRPELGWFGEGGSQRTNNTDSIYAYERAWVQTGMTYRR